MGIELRLPNITGATEKEQLLQVKSYLYQLSEQLQWAFDNINTTGGSGNGYVVNQAPRGYSATSSGLSSKDAEVTFATLKSLIIKSADIVDAYYEEINKKLVGVYVAKSDFGTYAKQTSMEIEANSTGITTAFENVQAIIKDTNGNIDNAINTSNAYTDAAKEEAKGYTDGKVSDLSDGLGDANSRIAGVEGELSDTKTELNNRIQTVSDSVSTVDRLLASAKEDLKGSIEDLEFDLRGLMQIVIGVTAYIKSGVLYETDAGVPVYGIEIGQEVEANGEKVFNKFSRFTSGKLSFYDANGNEVAYISDKKLYIGQAEITISFKVGGLIDLVMANGDVVTKWEGG